MFSGPDYLLVYSRDEEPLGNLNMNVAAAVASAEENAVLEAQIRTAVNEADGRHMVKPRKALREGEKIFFQVRIGF